MTRFLALRRYTDLAVLLTAFAVLSLGTLAYWNDHSFVGATGDEPHYLVVADALARDRSVDPTGAYEREWEQRDFFSGWPPAGTPIGSTGMHTRLDDHGRFGTHGLGVSVVLVPAALADSVDLGRQTMVVLAAGIVVLVWVAVRRERMHWQMRLAVATPLCLAVPVVAAGTQMYPDLVAGGVCLFGLLVLGGSERWHRPRELVFAGCGLAVLPWLQFRFGAAAIVLCAAIALRVWRRSGSRLSVAAVAAPVAVSTLGAVSFNLYAFGAIGGPFQSGVLQFDSAAVWRFVGLFIDQNHGFIAQQPLHLIGLLFLPRLFRRDPLLVATMVLVALTVLVPNALNASTYGGFSFIGRFSWPVGIVVMPATVFGMAELARATPRALLVIAAAALAIDAWCMEAMIDIERSVYNVDPRFWTETTSVFWAPISEALPSLYHPSWAWSYVPNLIGCAALAAVMVVGVRFRSRMRAALWPGLVCAAVLVAAATAAAVLVAAPRPPVTYSADELQRPPVAGEVFLVSLPLPEGSYRATLVYSNEDPRDVQFGTFDSFERWSATPSVLSVPLSGTDGRLGTVVQSFDIDASELGYIDYRFSVFTPAATAITVESLVIAERD